MPGRQRHPMLSKIRGEKHSMGIMQITNPSHVGSQVFRPMDSLIDAWFSSSRASPHTPRRASSSSSSSSSPPPVRPSSKPAKAKEKHDGQARFTVNQLLLRAHALLTYSPHQGSTTQALCYADRALDLAVEHRLERHCGKAQWFRGEALMRMERWESAYAAFVRSAGIVEGGWRRPGEVRQRMEACWRAKEEEEEAPEEQRHRGAAAAPKSRGGQLLLLPMGSTGGRRVGSKKVVRFQLGIQDDVGLTSDQIGSSD